MTSNKGDQRDHDDGIEHGDQNDCYSRSNLENRMVTGSNTENKRILRPNTDVKSINRYNVADQKDHQKRTLPIEGTETNNDPSDLTRVGLGTKATTTNPLAANKKAPSRINLRAGHHTPTHDNNHPRVVKPGCSTYSLLSVTKQP